MVWLYRWGSLRAFLQTVSTLEAVHGSVARQTTARLLAHAGDPVAALLLLFGLLLYVFRRAVDREDRLLLLGAFAGLISVVAQGKGFPYQRYPFLAFGLVVGFRLLSRGLETGGWQRMVAATAVCAVCVAVAPVYARQIRSYDRDAQFVSALTQELERLPGANGSVQCLDTVGGCVNALYDAGLTQATGYLYDCYAYSGSSESQKVYREKFLRAIVEARPRYVALSNQFCLAPIGDFDRVKRWPELNRIMNSEYRLSRTWESQREQRWWRRREKTFSFAIFTLK